MSKFNRLASFLLQLLLVASLASAEELKDHIENLDLSRPRTSLEKHQSKEINITDIIQILEEHEQDLTDLRITQGHTSEVIIGKLKRRIVTKQLGLIRRQHNVRWQYISKMNYRRFYFA